MGIIYPQAVKIHPMGKAIKYYSDLGYNIPMKKASPLITAKDGRTLVLDKKACIEVMIDDILDYSSAYIWGTCDCCGELMYISKSDYTRRHTNPDRPLYCKKCSSTTMNKGFLNGHWNPNLSQQERELKRKYPEYIDFVKRVLSRDNYTCQVCGKKSDGDLEVHHLNGYDWDIEHRTDDKNGITLCKDCHYNFHSAYGKGSNTKKQFEEWIGHRIELIEYFGEIYAMPRVYCIEDKVIYNDRFDAANKLNCQPGTIWRVCCGDTYTLYGKHYVYYEEYLKMSEEEVKELLSKGNKNYHEDRRVICKNTGELYQNASEAAQKIGYKHPENINNSCNGVQRSAGQINGKSLQWIWHRNFIKLPLSEQLQLALQSKDTLIQDSYLYNLLQDNHIIS